MADNDEDNLAERLMKLWWGNLLLAMFFFGLASLVYWYISSIEARGGGRVHWIVALVYNWAGKIGTVLLFAIPGTIFAIVGIWQLLANRGEDDE